MIKVATHYLFRRGLSGGMYCVIYYLEKISRSVMKNGFSADDQIFYTMMELAIDQLYVRREIYIQM